jgi:hypothetical protein
VAPLYYAAVGAREPARESVRQALVILPSSPELMGLAAALADPEGRGPLDVTPFIVGGT